MAGAEILLDTNIVSYLMRGGDLADRYRPHLKGKLLAVSFVTIGELYFGAEKRGWGELKWRSLNAMLSGLVAVPYDIEVARCYGRIVAHRHRIGRPITSNDTWIAACAVGYSIPLATHNATDFDEIPGLAVVTEQP
ncbi:MAG: type II toxin-antitoxin system VapC family toxin [Candidatus Hydrogenedentes bacterium]|nr:type II toxin-antitoxin system VapC family toxin [Candidatus Hydrogenedentota bacterium]